MARIAQQQAVAEAGNGAVEFGGEAGLAEDQLELRHGDQRLADGIAVAAQAAGDFDQDAKNFAHLFFGEAHQLVIQVDGLDGLDEQGGAAGAGAVDDAIELAALAGDDGHDEALVADGDEFLLQNALIAVGTEKALERLLNGALLALDIAAQAVERHAGMIGHTAVGQYLAFEIFEERAEIADGLRAPAESRKAFGNGGERRFRVGGAVEQREDGKNLLRFEARAFDAQLLDDGFGVRQAVEIHANGRTAPAGLRTRGEPLILHRFGSFGEVFL